MQHVTKFEGEKEPWRGDVQVHVLRMESGEEGESKYVI